MTLEQFKRGCEIKKEIEELSKYQSILKSFISDFENDEVEDMKAVRCMFTIQNWENHWKNLLHFTIPERYAETKSPSPFHKLLKEKFLNTIFSLNEEINTRISVLSLEFNNL